MNWFVGLKKHTRHKPFTCKTRKKALVEFSDTDSYYAVRIINAQCSPASQYMRKNFSFKHIPALPLVRCDADKCTCKYLGLVNRRKKEQRYRTRRLGTRLGKDRRTYDRRAEDRQWRCTS